MFLDIVTNTSNTRFLLVALVMFLTVVPSVIFFLRRTSKFFDEKVEQRKKRVAELMDVADEELVQLLEGANDHEKLVTALEVARARFSRCGDEVRRSVRALSRSDNPVVRLNAMKILDDRPTANTDS